MLVVIIPHLIVSATCLRHGGNSALITEDYGTTSGYEIRADRAEMGAPVAAAILPAEPKRRRGRPPGSANKIGRDAKALLAAHGLAGIRALCAIAAGKPVWRPLKGGGRERLVPELADMIAAQKAILSRLVPELKATELTGANGADLIPTRSDPRELSKSIIEILARGVPGGGKVAVTQAGEHTATFRDPDLGQRIFAEPVTDAPKPAEPPPTEPQPVARGRFIVAPSGNRWCICRVGDPAPLEFRNTYPDAVKRGEELDRQGKR